MLWLKRNLWLAVSGAVALVLVILGGYFVYQNLDQNSSLNGKLEEAKARLNRLSTLNPSPQPTNEILLKIEVARLREFLAACKRLFPPQPTNRLTKLAFKSLLDNTVANLRREARQANVDLPDRDNYAFSFDTLMNQVNFRDESLRLLPEQLEEVKTLCEIAFKAKVHDLESVRRVAASEYDQLNAPHILPRLQRTNAITGMVEWPYEIAFGAFSTELAAVLDGLEQSRLGFVVKSIVVVPGGPEGGPQPAPIPGLGPAPPPPGAPPDTRPGRLRGPPVRPLAVPAAAGPRPGLVTVLNERVLRVVLLVYLVKPV